MDPFAWVIVAPPDGGSPPKLAETIEPPYPKLKVGLQENGRYSWPVLALGHIAYLLGVGGCALPTPTSESTPVSAALSPETSPSDSSDSDAVDALEARLSVLEHQFQTLENRMLSTRSPATPVTTIDGSLPPSALAPPRTTAVASVPNYYLQDEGVQHLRAGLVLYRAGEYAGSTAEFRAFTIRYANHILASSGQFYLAHSLLGQGEKSLARLEFERLIRNFRNSPHLAEALLSLSQLEEAQGDLDLAGDHRRILTTVFRVSPATERSLQVGLSPLADQPKTLRPVATPFESTPL